MSTTVRPPDRLPTGPPDDEDPYRLAVEEARAQAEALRHAVSRANALVQQLEELVEGLRAILLYPKAYDWPLLESTTEHERPSEDADRVTLVEDEGGPELGRS
jgi:multidrug resistance efflux pump